MFPYIFLMVLFLAGCDLPGSSSPTKTVDAGGIMTAAAETAISRLTEAAANNSATPSPTPSETPTLEPTKVVLPTSIPTIVPIPGVVRANANIRSLPFKNKATDIGGIFFGQPVKVIGRNDDATWLYLLFADSPTGTGWVIAKAVTLSKEMGILPILIYPNGPDSEPIMIPPFIFEITGTPQPPSTPPADWPKFGTVVQAANVRIGPSVGFMTIGILNLGQKVTFRGRVADNVWVQIDYPSGPGGHGWILSELVQANDGFGGLPYFDVMGTPVTPTPEGQIAPGSDATQAPDLTQTSGGAQSATPSAPSGAEAEVTNQINVRSGPAQTFKSYGMLNPKDKVIITGLTLNKYWYQIQYSGSPTGFGWVASQYLRVLGDMRKTPYFTNEGTPIPQ
jgi:uncharacterized protein YraI